jgi:L-alanine-DL-glutamate epimerase-like enolase superfamily enzyme
MRWLTTPYRLPLRRPWPGLGLYRHGWIVAVTEGGITGYGDCAPLWGEISAAVVCAIETALCDRAARQAGVPLARWLNPRCGLRVAVNEVLPGSAGILPAQVVKLKLPPNVDDALRLIESTPGTLRLDANRAYSFDDAARLLRAIADRPIDHFEEPLREPNVADLMALQALAPFPIAVDESLTGLGVDAVLEAGIRRLVLKPMLLGGPLRVLEVAGQARAAGAGVVVTTAMDSAIGAWAAAHLAAAVDDGLAHGLDTSRWLAEDLAVGPAPLDGRLEIPELPGLGVVA